MAKSTASEWISSIEEELDWLRERTEGDLLHRPLDGRHVRVALRRHAPRVDPRHHSYKRLRVPEESGNSPRLVFDKNAPATVPGVGSDIKASGTEELVYPEIPLPAVKEFMALMRVTDDLLPTIETPALIFQSLEDHVVPPENGPYIQSQLGSRYRQLARLEKLLPRRYPGQRRELHRRADDPLHHGDLAAERQPSADWQKQTLL